MNPRPKGVMTYHSPKNPIVEEAKRRQRQNQEQLAAARERRANRPVPNYIAYSFLFPNFDPKTGKGAPCPLPKCRVCHEGVLHPMEHHNCEGFKPMYKERTPEERREREEQRRERQRERWEEERDMIREAKRNGMFFSEDQDEPEEDYCEGDDDGWECEDDGDPMWD